MGGTNSVLKNNTKKLNKHPVNSVPGGLPPIRLIRFDDMVRLGTFPRCPDNTDIVHDLDKIDRDTSLLVFISHCWMRGYSGAEGWDGRPHPDSASGEKFELCVKGIKSLKDTFAPRMKDCYVWFDFGCINQDGNPAGELKQLDKIVECCDCIFTPIVDREHASWSLPMSITSLYVAYGAKLWNDGPHAYLNRGWCRVEMLYAANIPVLENSSSNSVGVKRHTLFEASLAYHCSQNRRPHYLYGSKEFFGVNGIPYTLPPLQHTWLNNWHPLKGNLSVTSDLEHIKQLLLELQPYLDANKIDVGYRGESNLLGMRHGHGIFRYADGSVYEGEWKDDKIHGHGTFQSAIGEVYEGEWQNDKKHGHGIFRYAEGEVYEGEWKDDRTHGHGTYRAADGDVYEGEWKDDKKHGYGTHQSAGGEVYKGEWQNDKQHGHGIFRSADGNVYEGEWKDDKYHGHGTYRYTDGDVYEGEFQEGMRNGHGTYRYADGSVYEGEWKDDKYHGHGTYRAADGDVYEGEWQNDKKHGHGTYRAASGDVYEGEWKDDKYHGHGTY